MKNTSSKLLNSVILSTLSKYLDEGYSAQQVNSGQCEDFALDVRSSLEKSLQMEVVVVYTEDFESSDGSGWNWAGLGPGGCRIDPLPSEDKESLNHVFGGHCWLVYRGKHYDCESPDGVNNFFDLQFFRRSLDRVKEKQSKLRYRMSG